MSDSVILTPIQAQKIADLTNALIASDPDNAELQIRNEAVIGSGDVISVAEFTGKAWQTNWLIGRNGGVIEL